MTIGVNEGDVLASSPPAPRHCGFQVAVFTPLLVVYVDRQLLSLVVDRVKISLRLSDMEIGVLQGFAFTIVLASTGLFTARLIDRGNRVKLLATCTVI